MQDALKTFVARTPFALFLCFGLLVAGCEDNPIDVAEEPATFTMTIENVSTPGLLPAERLNGIVPLSPGVFVTFEGDGIFEENSPAFTVGEPADSGTRLIAEDGFPAPQPFIDDATELELLRGSENVLQVGVFKAPGPPPGGGPDSPTIFPGETATVTFEATPGQRLQIETMFVQSDDWFYAFTGGGLELFVDGEPISGEVTDELALYDSGTEIQAPPGEGQPEPPGPVQKPAQPPMGTDIGTDESVPVLPVRERDDYEFTVPPAQEVIRVTITAEPQQ